MSGEYESITVLLVDDEPLLRRSLRIAIDHEPGLTVIGDAGTGTEAVSLTFDLRPDVVLMDIRMPDGNGIDATRQITADCTDGAPKVIILTMFELDEYVFEALSAGASAFLLKDATPGQLVDAVRKVHAGESLFAPTVLDRLIRHYVDNPTSGRPHSARPTSPGVQYLTNRELEVLTLIAKGLSNDEIAHRLSVSPHTVKAHVGSLRSKLHARDRAQLVIAAYEARINCPTPGPD
ncbi:response regulator transcription factor [Pseudoclavibacter endophyticus]|uniref:Response regulator transcription factor n=2 Tax=Pseudoclavibacter endophyticus TaxID=1778590 RepID=A0A6H9WMZ6_9MICO|nr:response regulator transcription factor [Pseudoclavibacter endophyticus]